jgi:hypothetical protein
LQGVFEKTGGRTWFFGGEIVVVCGELAGAFPASKIFHGFRIYF